MYSFCAQLNCINTYGKNESDGLWFHGVVVFGEVT